MYTCKLENFVVIRSQLMRSLERFQLLCAVSAPVFFHRLTHPRRRGGNVLVRTLYQIKDYITLGYNTHVQPGLPHRCRAYWLRCSRQYLIFHSIYPPHLQCSLSLFFFSYPIHVYTRPAYKPIVISVYVYNFGCFYPGRIRTRERYFFFFFFLKRSGNITGPAVNIGPFGAVPRSLARSRDY